MILIIQSMVFIETLPIGICPITGSLSPAILAVGHIIPLLVGSFIVVIKRFKFFAFSASAQCFHDGIISMNLS